MRDRTAGAESVVSAEGRAEPHPLTLRGRDAYNDLYAAVRTAVLRGRFTPAAVAGCPVRQLVKLPVAFTIDR